MPIINLDIPVFYGTYADLTKIDVSFFNGRIVTYKGKYFRDCLKSLLEPTMFKFSYKSATSDPDQTSLYENQKIKRYAIIPLDLKQPLLEEHWHHFHELMLSIFPSDFSLVEVIHLRPLGTHYQSGGKSYYSFKSTGERYFENFMHIARQEYKYVRHYLKTYFHSSYDLKYVKYILSVYSNSFVGTNLIYQYLSLIICLEVTVEGNEQLTYRLKRNIALLCGNKKSACEYIYDNVNQLYKLRSAIVHGNIKPSYKNFQEYHKYLKTLVARLIRELIVHNISTVKDLNDIITTLGYGQNNLISKNYTSSKYPIIDNIHLTYTAIQKY